jgi:hypothetical protein
MKKWMLFTMMLGLATHVFAQGAGNALEFDDTDDYVYVGDHDVLDLNHFTLMAWVKPYSRGSDPARIEILEKTDSYWMNIRRDTGVLRCGGYFGPTRENRWHAQDSDKPIPLNEWTHCSCTYDGKLLKVYLNGEEAGTKEVPDFLQEYDYSLAIGAKITYSGKRQALFHGSIDEVSIWNVALTQTTIQEWLNKPLTSSHPQWNNLVVYYQFNEDKVGQKEGTVRDTKGNVDAKNNGATWILNNELILPIER